MDKADEPQRPWRVSMGKARPWRTSPWCPSPEDGGFLIDATRQALACPQPTVLVLGATPEIVQLGWPEGSELIALDLSADMIAMDWQPHPYLRSNIVEARWQQMPLPDGSIDAAVGDASLNALPGFDHYAPVLDEVARVLKPGGALAVRMFLRDEQSESCADVVDQAARGQFANGVPFRLRFAMAATGPDGVVEFAGLPILFDAIVADRDALARSAGWSREDLDRVDIYANNRTRINFPTAAELSRLIAPRFVLEALRYPVGYSQADRCPTAILRKS